MLRLIGALVLLGANILLWSVPVPQGLTVSFLNIGQGDAILITGPTGVQVLVDGGPDSSVLREVGQQLPFWDKTLDAVVATHPDQDHIGGLPDILNRYEVGTILEPGIDNTTRAWIAFVDATNAELQSGARHMLARRGMRITLGGGAYADLLYPASDVSAVKDTNSGSVVMRVQYGATSFMLTGDAPAEVEQKVIAAGDVLKSTVLKAGHHGSKTSSSPEFIEAVNPQYAVFSRGCDNRYGHPAPSVVELFQSLHIGIFDTCEQGTIDFHSDGQVVWVAP